MPGVPIVFTSRDERLKYDIFVVNPDSGEITRLTQDEGNNESPTFSPDGNQIAFTSTRRTLLDFLSRCMITAIR